MKRTVFGLLVCLLVPLASLYAGDATPKPSDKPNILFILIDDYGIKDVGVEGSSFYETPQIDALARSGMRFTQGYAACQVCSPSRASIMSVGYKSRLMTGTTQGALRFGIWRLGGRVFPGPGEARLLRRSKSRLEVCCGYAVGRRPSAMAADRFPGRRRPGP